MATGKSTSVRQDCLDIDRQTLPAFILGSDPAQDPALAHFGALLKSLGLDEQPDLAGILMGRILVTQATLPGFDYNTAAAILRDVARAVHQWRSDWTETGSCPLCGRLA